MPIEIQAGGGVDVGGSVVDGDQTITTAGRDVAQKEERKKAASIVGLLVKVLMAFGLGGPAKAVQGLLKGR